MKKIIFVFIISLFTGNLFAQQVNYKELIGSWLMADTSQGKMVYQFVDSVNVNLIYDNGISKPVPSKSTYTLGYINDVTRLNIMSTQGGMAQRTAFRLKKISADSIKMQIDSLTFPLDWDEEKGMNTALFLRIKTN